jgi:putative peptide zinc metalloprotease protein
LMRYDGYYVLADWLEIPNLRDRANKYLQNLAMDWCLGIEVPPEQYMETWRKVLFVVFAVISYIYRWVVTFIILQFMATFLKPYKLEVLSELLAVGALASMIGWPMYRLIKNVRKRGRLPDMKPTRVTISAAIVVILLALVFFLPLPVTRIRNQGFVQVQPTEIAQVTVQVPGILKAIHVKEGQAVKKGRVLAEFTSLELENQRDQAASQMEIKEKVLRYHEDQISKEQDAGKKSQMQEQRGKIEGEWRQAIRSHEHVLLAMDKLKLRAPRDGVVIGLPQIDEVGKYWDKDATELFCSIGNRTKLRVLMPLSPSDYDLLQENIRKAERAQKPLEATIRVQGHDSRTWKGRVSELPKQDARSIPPQLANKFGGPLAIKPTSGPNELVPQSQVFLVGVEFEQADDTIAINSGAQVKIHCEYRSTAWWIYRTVASTFDVGLMKW